MLLVEIGTAGVISAYFYMHITSDPIERQQVQLSDYLFVFGCGLVFWLLVLLRAKLHGSGDRQADNLKVAKLAKLIAPITTLNLCGCLLAPFMKLPLLVRFLVLFQVSSNLALLLIWAFLSLKECMNLPDAHTQQQQKSSPEPQAVQQQRRGAGGKVEIIKMSLALTAQTTGTLMGFRLIPTPSSSSKVVLVVALMDQLVAFLCVVTGILLSSNKPKDLNIAKIFAAKIFAGVGIFCYKSGYILMIAMCVLMFVPWYSVLIAVLLFGFVWLNFFRNGLTTLAIEVWKKIIFYLLSLLFLAFVVPCSSANTGQDFDNSEIIKISLGLTAQTTGTLMGFNLIPTPSSSSKAVLVVALMAQLVAFLCGATGILLSLNKPENLIAGKIFGNMTFVSYMLGYILLVAMYVDMFVPWYSVLIVVLLFGVVWLILFWNELKNHARDVWSWLKSRAAKSI